MKWSTLDDLSPGAGPRHRIREPRSHVARLRPTITPTLPSDLYVVVRLTNGWPVLAPDCDPCPRVEADAIARELIELGDGPVLVCRLEVAS